MNKKTALIVVDMQKYYLCPDSDFYRYASERLESSMDYISTRCQEMVIPNIQKLLDFFRKQNGCIIFLKLCGQNPHRQDLHRFFKNEYQKGLKSGYPGIYPLSTEPMADIISEISPCPGEIIIEKTTFSAFNSTKIYDCLVQNGVETLVFTGLATSQCVETTARDASDTGFSVIHIEDAQADYSETNHRVSIYSSAAVCGGWIYNTQSFIEHFNDYLKLIQAEER